jgi:apolipoprotein N-acyltransferase
VIDTSRPAAGRSGVRIRPFELPHVAARQIVLVLASGICFVACFPPVDWGGLAWVALVPLLAAASRRPPRAAFALGYLWGIVALGGILWWLVTFGVAVWIMVALLLAFAPAAVMGAVAWTEGGGRWPVLGIPVLWTAVEFLRSQGPLGFPWALIGETQHTALAAAQIASIAGVYGVSFLVVLANAAVYLVLARRDWVPALLAAGGVAAAVLYGGAVLREPVPATMAAGIVQPNYAIRTHWDPQQAAADFAVLGTLTRQAGARGAVLVLWPETASPTDIAGDPATLARIRSWVRNGRITLIASSLEAGQANSAFSFTPGGALAGRYDKERLVPFAEAGERRGRGPAVLPTPSGPIGIAICFESIFPDVARRSVDAGARILGVITNDGWFDRGTVPAQHAAIAPFRAIEEDRYLLRAANAGPSEIIDPHGRVLAALPRDTRGVLVIPVAPIGTRTLYARFGDLFGWAVVLAALVLVIPRVLRSGRHQTGTAGLLPLLVASGLPLAALWSAEALVARAPGAAEVIPLPLLAMLAVTVLLSVRTKARDLGFGFAGFVPAAALGFAAVGLFTAIAVSAFSTHSVVPNLPPPQGGWWIGGAVAILVAGLAMEWWLRGLVFSAAAAWRGWQAAVVWSALLGMLAAGPLGAEAMILGLAGGVAFGLIRVRWPQVPALAVAHGAGILALRFLISSW